MSLTAFPDAAYGCYVMDRPVPCSSATHGVSGPPSVLADRTLLERSGLEVSRIGLGLAHVHLLSDDAARKQLLYRALDLGVTHFDTSRFYSDGLSEATVGKFLAQNRRYITITTKFGLLPTPFLGSMGAMARPLRKARSVMSRLGMIEYPRRSYDQATMRKSLQDSLRALKTDYIDIYMIHEPLPASPLDGFLFEELLKEKQKGSIRFVGVSGATIDAAVQLQGPLLDVIQAAESSWTAARFVPDVTHSLFSEKLHKRGNTLDGGSVRMLLHAALARRSRGAVIVQTRNVDHLTEIVAMAAGR